jgi:hypothetical protein
MLIEFMLSASKLYLNPLCISVCFSHISSQTLAQANCVDSTAEPAAVFASEVKKLKEIGFKPKEQLTLEPYERDHAVVCARARLCFFICFLL